MNKMKTMNIIKPLQYLLGALKIVIMKSKNGRNLLESPNCEVFGLLALLNEFLVLIKVVFEELRDYEEVLLVVEVIVEF